VNLLELQRRMAEDVTRPLTPDFQMQPSTSEGKSTQELANTYIKPNDRLSSFDRLEIYNRQYWFRVIGAVSEDFPAIAAILGPKKFDTMVLAYLRENPSTSFTLRNLGSKLPKWLESHPEFYPRRHSLLLDVARLEWAYVEAFDGADPTHRCRLRRSRRCVSTLSSALLAAVGPPLSSRRTRPGRPSSDRPQRHYE
jgi:hypothetical protein